jgi:uncharacterized protein
VFRRCFGRDRSVGDRRLVFFLPVRNGAIVSPSEENKQFVLDSYRAFGAREKKQIASFFAPEAEWIVPEDNATVLALGQTSGFVGRDAIVKYLTEDLARLFSNAKTAVVSVIADSEHVVVEQRYEARLCNGRFYKMTFCFVFAVRDRLIREVRAYFDTSLGFKQIFGEEKPRRLV